MFNKNRGTDCRKRNKSLSQLRNETQHHVVQWNLAWLELFTRVFTVVPLFSSYTAYLPAFVIVREVAVTRETSCTKLLPGVGVLIGLMKMSKTKQMLKLLLSQ